MRDVKDGGAAGAPQDEFCRELGAGVGDPLPTSSVVLLAARAALRFARMAASLSPSSAMSLKTRTILEIHEFSNLNAGKFVLIRKNQVFNLHLVGSN
jgi:hypothetical protein